MLSSKRLLEKPLVVPMLSLSPSRLFDLVYRGILEFIITEYSKVRIIFAPKSQVLSEFLKFRFLKFDTFRIENHSNHHTSFRGPFVEECSQSASVPLQLQFTFLELYSNVSDKKCPLAHRFWLCFRFLVVNGKAVLETSLDTVDSYTKNYAQIALKKKAFLHTEFGFA